ncbi:unnamed protein product, partial [marine sediment metagenome]
EEFTKFVSDTDLAKGMDQLIHYVLEIVHQC